MILDVNFGYENLLEDFPDFDITKCKRPWLIDFNVKGNITGDQQRAFVIWGAIREFEKQGRPGISLGCGQVIEPFCVGLDFYSGPHHPDYGGEYKPHLTYKCEKLPFNDNTVAFEISHHSLEHMNNTLETLKEWIRVLIPGGALYIIMPDEKYKHYPEDLTHKAHFSAEQFKEQVLDKVVGLAEIEQFSTFANFFSFNVILRKK